MCLCLRNTTVRARRLFPAPRARESFLFFSLFFALLSPFPSSPPPVPFLRRGAPYSRRARLSMGNRSCQWSPSPNIIRRDLSVHGSLASYRASVEIPPSYFSPFLAIYPLLLPALSSNLWKIIFVNRRCRPMFLILSRRRRSRALVRNFILSFDVYFSSFLLHSSLSFTSFIFFFS